MLPFRGTVGLTRRRMARLKISERIRITQLAADRLRRGAI